MDRYYSIAQTGTSRYTEKMSRFLSFAIPVETADEAKEKIKAYQNEYHDARHVCWAYMIGPERKEWQLNDNGEPSGTAGKPILGQINSFELTNVLVIVVRYFGGIKLGTSGLISAYREAARLALEDGGRKEYRQTERLELTFPYARAEGVMRVIKNSEVRVIARDFDMHCKMIIEYPLDLSDEIKGRLSAADEVVMKESK